jgi:hypothetical protein
VRALVRLGWSYLRGLQLLVRRSDLLLLGLGTTWVGAFAFRLVVCYYYYSFIFFLFICIYAFQLPSTRLLLVGLMLYTMFIRRSEVIILSHFC